MTWANGDKYVGNWDHDSRHGMGIMIYANGDKYDGNWVDGKCTSIIIHVE